MKYLIKLFFCILIFNIPVLADCNYERLSLGTGSEIVKSVYNIDVQIDKENFSLSSSSPKGVKGHKICDDNKYDDLNFRFFFIDHILQLISIIDNNSEINHFENLVNFYGKPTYQRITKNIDGIDDHHWAFSDKDIFLQIIKQNEEIISNIKIIDKNYVSKLNSFESDDDVLH